MKQWFWTEKEDSILKEHYGKLTCKEISKILQNRSPYAIQKRANYLGLKSSPRLGPIKYTVNQNFFSEPNIQNSYWAGFIAGDGHLAERNKTLKIGLSIKDDHLLHSFKEQTQFTGVVRYTSNKSGFCKGDIVTIDINCVPQWFDDLLINWNIHSGKKTFNLKPPINLIDRTCICAYIVGLIDADGMISYGKRKKLHIGVAGTYDVMKWISNHVANFLGEDYRRNINKHKTIWRIDWMNKRAQDVAEFLDESTQITWKLQRKWNNIKKNTVEKISRRWTQEEIDILRNNFYNLSYTELTKLLPDREYDSIKKYCTNVLNLKHIRIDPSTTLDIKLNASHIEFFNVNTCLKKRLNILQLLESGLTPNEVKQALNVSHRTIRRAYDNYLEIN